MSKRRRWVALLLPWGASIAVTLTDAKGWFESIPDWSIALLWIVTIAASFWFALTSNPVRSHYHLLYSYPKMSLVIFISAGLIFGGLSGYLMWWSIRRESIAQAAPAATKSSTDSAQAQSRAPVSQEPRTHVKLIFKASPVFTDERKKSIQREIDALHEYLSQIGFALPDELPPVGTRPGKSMAESFVTPGTIYEAAIYFPEDGIEDPTNIRMVYAHHTFRSLFGVLEDPKTPFVNEVESVFASYYVSSFSDRNVDEGDDSKWKDANWVNALWNIRQKLGKNFVDMAMFCAFKTWRKPGPEEKNFNEFFYGRFLSGVWAVDNAGQNMSTVNGILKEKGLSLK